MEDKNNENESPNSFQPTSKDMQIPLSPSASIPGLSRHFSADFLFKKTISEEIFTDIKNTDELVDEYWSKGWTTTYHTTNRTNFTEYFGHYYCAFPTRYRLPEFTMSKSFRRIYRKNRELKTIIRPFRITEKKVKLHDRFHILRFREFPSETLQTKYKYPSLSPAPIYEICVYKQDKLIACSIFQLGNYSIVSNECFWDLNYAKHELGTYTILLEINFALSRKMYYYYLGYYYIQNPNFEYKTRFPGLELFDITGEFWVDYKNAGELLLRELPDYED
jgi:leucyl-tRNA---protein transferase